MFENGLILKVKNGPFGTEKYHDFELLKKTDENNKNFSSTVIYGRNGSGKTTICNALEEIRNESENKKFDIVLSDINHVIYSDVEKEKVFIFNEKFIDEEIKLKENGLETIVLLGENLKVDKQIDAIREEI